MDLTNYPAMKASGQSKLAKLNNAYVMVAKKFDPATGLALSPDLQAMDVAQVQAMIADHQAKIDALNALLADIKALG